MCALGPGVQTCALPISALARVLNAKLANRQQWRIGVCIAQENSLALFQTRSGRASCRCEQGRVRASSAQAVLKHSEHRKCEIGPRSRQIACYSKSERSIHAVFSCSCMRCVSRSQVGSSADLSAIGNTLRAVFAQARSEEHMSELQSLMRISYSVFCLK